MKSELKHQILDSFETGNPVFCKNEKVIRIEYSSDGYPHGLVTEAKSFFRFNAIADNDITILDPTGWYCDVCSGSGEDEHGGSCVNCDGCGNLDYDPFSN